MEYPFKDLMPLDEVLEREGYYKDWTHLDPETFYSITQISEMIKTKGFGTDVRLLISQLAEHFGLSVAEVVRISNGLIARQSAVENRQDAVEHFNNQVIQEMTDKDVISAPEIIEARGGEARVAIRINKISDATSQSALKLANSYTVEEFGAVGDGITDDSEAIQTAFDTIPEHSSLLFSNDTYLLMSPVTYRRSNLHVNFNNAKFLWAGVDDLETTGRGAVEFEGALDSNRNFISNVAPDPNGTKLSLTGSTETIEVDEYVGLTIRGGQGTPHNGKYDNYKPSVGTLAKVVEVGADYIIVDYFCPFDYSKVLYDGWINKVQPVSNITIENLNIESTTSSTLPTSWVHMVKFSQVVNFEIRNIYASKFKYKGLRLSQCREGIIDSCHFNDPTEISGGRGYGVQIANSNRIELRRVTGNRLRHLIDFSTSHHCKVYDSHATDSFNRTFDCHGLSEHDIEFIDCDGDYIFSNGMTEFPSVVENITILRGTIRGISGGAVHNLTCDSTTMTDLFLYSDAIGDLKLINNKIYHKQRVTRNITNSSRGGYFDRGHTVEMTGNTLIFEDLESNAVGWIFRFFKTVSIKDNIIKSINTLGGEVKSGVITVVSPRYLYFSNNHTENMMLRFNGLSVEKITVNNNTFSNNQVATQAGGSSFIDVLSPVEKTDLPMTISWSGNTFASVNPTRWIRINERIGNGDSVLLMLDNVFSGSIIEAINGGTLFDNITRVNRGNINLSTLTSKVVIFETL